MDKPSSNWVIKRKLSPKRLVWLLLVVAFGLWSVWRLANNIFRGGQPETYIALSIGEGPFIIKTTAPDGRDRYGYINRDGEVVIEPVFSNALLFTEGLAAVSSGTLDISKEQKSDAWGFLGGY
ncbi:MAG: WG repeat-containing protein [bacterium]